VNNIAVRQEDFDRFFASGELQDTGFFTAGSENEEVG
jgi:hypothetical protein